MCVCVCVTRVPILDEAVYISHSANILGKGMNPTIPSPVLGKCWGRLCSLTLVWQLVYEKENSEFKSVKLCSKIDDVSHHARAVGLVYIYIYIYHSWNLDCDPLVRHKPTK